MQIWCNECIPCCNAASTHDNEGIPTPRERWFSGIGLDLAGRLPLYKSDWTLANSEEAKKILAATLFAYFTSVLPAVIFGDTLRKSTNGVYGLTEVLVSTGGIGILYSVFAGQGLVIVGVTGPVVFFQITVWTLADAMGAPFLQLNAWVNIWCGIMHIFVAAGGWTTLVQRVTAFSGEIFGFFISIAYIYLGARNLVDLFPPNMTTRDGSNDTSLRLASAFASIILAALMYMGAMTCHRAKQWRSLNDIGRWLMQSYGLVLTLVVCTALSYLPIFYNPHIGIVRLPVPDSGSAFVPSETVGRKGWPVDLMGGDGDGNTMEAWMVFVAILPAVMLLILFFFDHNVSSIMAQDPKFNLRKSSAFNYDCAVLGVTVVLCGVFGVPPGNGLIPQAPLHVRALAVVEYVDAPGGKREVYTAVAEKRWSNLLQSVLVLITVLVYPVLKLIPQAVLSGTFIYMGASGFLGNGLFDRLQLLGMQAERRPAFEFLEFVSFAQVVRYTLLQLTAVLIIFVVSFNFFLPEGSPSIAIVFPLLIAALIPIRERCLPTKFTEAELLHLDPLPEIAEDLAQKEADYDRTKPLLTAEDLGMFQSFERFRAISSLRRRTEVASPELVAPRLERSSTAPL
jgi:hypothetical protein